MATLELQNQNTTSALKKVIFEITYKSNLAFLYFQEQKPTTIETTEFLKQYLEEFLHPLFQMQPATFKDGQWVYNIRNYDDLKNIFSVIYITLIRYAAKCRRVYVTCDKAFTAPFKFESVAYSISPLKQPTQAISKIDLEALVRNLPYPSRFQFYHGLYFDTDISIENLPQQQTYDALIDDSLQLALISEPIELRYISDPMGHGAFANRAIKKGEIVTFYAGEVLQEKHAKRSLYKHQFPKQMPGMILDGKNFGNLSRFINHGPSTIKKKRLSANSIALANLDISYQNYCGLGLICFKANRHINKHEQLLYNYGQKYWNKRPPIFFNQQGFPVNQRGRKYRQLMKTSASTLHNMSACNLPDARKKLLIKPTMLLIVLITAAVILNQYF